MIKLNNKNITYVALADSNNSLKAPKEIWYADSNNSVKLVYRRKDALIEGEDYEKYHWIVGDNVAYIDGLDYNLWQNTLQIQIGKVDGNCQYFGLNLLYNSQTRNGSFFQLMSSGGIFKTYFRDRINEHGWVGWFNLNNMPSVVAFEYYIEDNKAVAIVNGVKTYDTISSNTLTESVWNKYVPINTKDGNNIYTKLAKVSYIRELLPNNTYRSNLIPCKLLKPVPKWLDANGIRRQVGECGMIDLVSGKFYGNVANSGTFKAVNLAEGVDYEVYQWLVGDGTARIIKNFNFWQNKLEVEVGNDQGNQFSTNYNDTGVYVAAVYNSGGGNPYMLVSFRETTSGHIRDVLYSQFPERLSMVFYIEDGIAYCNQNGTLYTGQQLTESVWNKDIPLRIYAKEMAYIRELLPNGTYRSNLVPCKLLRSIPSKYDANGIARQAGECGMYDTVSDRFYGNVASSGTFSVSDD